MLDPWIIEEIRRREEDRRNERQRPVIEIELPKGVGDEETRERGKPADADQPRGVVVIDFSPG